MPLIDVTIRPGFSFRTTDNRRLDAQASRHFTRTVFGPALPGLFIDQSDELGLAEGTPVEGIQVQFHNYGEDDINVADIWVKVQFSEEQPMKLNRHVIRDRVYAVLLDVFAEHDLVVPANFILDVFWGPTHGRGLINGTAIEW